MKKLLHFLKLAWSVSPAYLLLLTGQSVCNAAKTIFNTILPMFLVNELIGARDVKQLALYSGLIILNNVGMTFLSNTFIRFTSVGEEKTGHGMLKLMSEKIRNSASVQVSTSNRYRCIYRRAFWYSGRF